MAAKTRPTGDDPHFTTEAARAIFRRAAEHQEMARAALQADADGLSLADLQSIGAEAGIDPAYIAAAAAELQTDEADEDVPWWYAGSPTIEAEAVVPGTITDGPVWAAMVRELRDAFADDGTATQLDTTLEWSTNKNGRSIRVTATPEAYGTRIRIGQSTKDSAQVIAILTGTFLSASLLLGSLFAMGSFDSDVLMLPVIFAAAALLCFGVGTPLYRSHLRRQQQTFDGVMDRLELIALKANATSTDKPKLDASVMDEANEIADSAETGSARTARERTRS